VQSVVIYPQTEILFPTTNPTVVFTSDIPSGVEFHATALYNEFSPYPISVARDLDATPSTGIVVSSSISDLSLGGFLYALAQNPSLVRAQLNRSSPTNLIITVQSDTYSAPQGETVNMTITRAAMLRNGTSIVRSMDSFSFTITPSQDTIAAVQNNFVGAVVVLSAVSALASGPSLATQGSRIFVLVDSATCPVSNWVQQKQLSMTAMMNPFGVAIGSIDDLGMYFGAAVFDAVFIVIYTSIHLIVVMVYFARRLDYHAGQDSPWQVAMRSLKFPGLELFPAFYFCGFVVLSSLKVIAYSPLSLFRGLAGIPLAAATVGLLGFLVYELRRPGASYSAYNLDVMPMLFRVFGERGVWVVDAKAQEGLTSQGILRLKRFLDKYGMLFEDFTGECKTFYLVDVTFTIVMCGIASVEPSSINGCTVKLSLLHLVYDAYFVILLRLRPYRRHVFNGLFVLISFTQIVSISISLATLLSNKAATYGERAANITMISVGALVALKTFADVYVYMRNLSRYLHASGRLNAVHIHESRKLKVKEEVTIGDYFHEYEGSIFDKMIPLTREQELMVQKEEARAAQPCDDTLDGFIDVAAML
jgi:hypothetical protein